MTLGSPFMLHFRFHPEVSIQINFYSWLDSMAQTHSSVFFFEHCVLVLLKRLRDVKFSWLHGKFIIIEGQFFFCFSNELIFLINDARLSFVFKNLFLKCFWHTKIVFRESQVVVLTSFSHICSEFSFQDLEISALSHHFNS